MKNMKLGKMLLLASFTGTFAEGMLLPLWSVFTGKNGGSVLDAGIGYAIFSIATGLVVMFIGSTDFFERNNKWFLLYGFALAGIGDLSYMLVRNKWELFAVQCLIGISVGIANPAWDALYSDDEEDEKNNSKRWSFWTGGISFVSGLSALAGGLIVKLYGFNAMFVAMFVCDIASVFYCYHIVKHDGIED